MSTRSWVNQCKKCVHIFLTIYRSSSVCPVPLLLRIKKKSFCLELTPAVRKSVFISLLFVYLSLLCLSCLPGIGILIIRLPKSDRIINDLISEFRAQMMRQEEEYLIMKYCEIYLTSVFMPRIHKDLLHCKVNQAYFEPCSYFLSMFFKWSTILIFML